MSAMAAGQARRAQIHPAWVRICHWINALAILVMIAATVTGRTRSKT